VLQEVSLRRRLELEPPGVEVLQVVRVRQVALQVRLLERRSRVKVTWRVAERPKQLEPPKVLPLGLEQMRFVEESQRPAVPEMEGMTWSSLRLAQHQYSPRRIGEKS